LYNYDQIEVYSKDNPSKILLIIQIGIKEVQSLLAEVGPHCIDSWVPRIDDHQLVILKVIQNMIPEPFGRKLLCQRYRLLSEEEYIKNKEVFDCFCKGKK
jgi:hypothetical protein